MLRIVLPYPTGRTVPLTLEVHEVPRSTIHLAGDAAPEAVKLGHIARAALGHLAYEFDPIGVNLSHVG